MMHENGFDTFWTKEIDFIWTPVVILAIAGFIIGAVYWVPDAAERAVKKSSEYARREKLILSVDAEIEKAQATAQMTKHKADDDLAAKLNAIRHDAETDAKAKAQKLADARKVLQGLNAGAESNQDSTQNSISKNAKEKEYLAFMKWLQDERSNEYADLQNKREKSADLDSHVASQKKELELRGEKTRGNETLKALEKAANVAKKELDDCSTKLENEYFERKIAESRARIDAELNGKDGSPGLNAIKERTKTSCDKLFEEARAKLGTL